MRDRNADSLGATIFIWVVSALMLVGGLALLGGGLYLVTLGGSWYFAIAGAALVFTSALMIMRNGWAVWLFAAIFVGTLLWSFWEVGFEFWPLVSRLAAPAVLGMLVFLAAPLLRRRGPVVGRSIGFGVAALFAAGLVGTVIYAFNPGPIVAAATVPTVIDASATSQPEEWRHYGSTPAGTRFAPFGQITKENVNQLEVAWTFQTGDVPLSPTGNGAEDQNTPIQVGDTVYACTVHNIVYALDAETGEQRWRFDPQADSPYWQRCRGVGYYESTEATSPDALCARRIVLSTIDARLMELDAGSGEPCPAFGEGGTVDLKLGMGEVNPGFYFQTSAPTVTRNLVIIGGWVIDNVAVGEPSGVVRAFSAESGELVWAWDLGNPDITTLPPEGESYTRGTPNVWSTPAFDEELGLVYVPTGNATPDFFGGHRSERSELYSSSVVALEIETGRERWRFQTTHHDIWDYDVPAQPALYDVPDSNGGTVPALIQVTKRGQTFVLDRRTGEPITPVEERPVPQGAAEGDWTAPTQPYSVGMPQIGAERLTEADMWGATPFDQLFCRIEFRKLRYEGDFTPPGLTPSLQWPGYFGGMNWGSVAIDETNDYLIVNDTRSPHRVQLVPRGEADRADAAESHTGLSGQLGTPYGAAKSTFMSPLGIPCQHPPYGTLTAIDLKTKSIVWQVPMGTVRDTGPLGIKMGFDIPVGMPTVGGPVATQSGVVFYAGTLDYALRALDVATGRELWKTRLPVGSQGTPMTYISPQSGRQFVVVSAGGARQSPDRGDYIVAFSLPEED